MFIIDSWFGGLATDPFVAMIPVVYLLLWW